MEQNKLPIKTKVVAWIILFSGVFGFLFSGAFPYGDFPSWVLDTFAGYYKFFEKTSIPSNPGISLLLISLFLIYYIGTFFIAPIFLLLRKKWAWWFAIISLFLSLIFIIFCYYPVFPYYGPYSGIKGFIYGTTFFWPIILFNLLLLDRKNFWKIAS